MRTLALVFAALFSLAANAQSWPQKPVRFIVPFAPGGATDIAARMLGEKLSQLWGQSVLVENRAGAGGSLGAAEAARAAADGYTLFFPSGSVMTANQHVYAKLNYDPERDFVPVTNVVSGPQVLVVPANSPYKTVKELIDAGVIRLKAKEPIPNRLVELERELSDLVDECKPDICAVEQLYSHYKHPRTAILMGHARGVILLVAAQHGIQIEQFAANRIKQSLTGYGHAGKQQMHANG